jgi:hypothetical protein
VKTLIIILFISSLSFGQVHNGMSAIFGVSSGLSEGWRIKETYNSSLSATAKKALNKQWHDARLVAHASGVGLGLSLALEHQDWVSTGLKVLEDAMIFNFLNDMTINVILDRPLLYQSKSSGWALEMFLTPQLKIFALLTVLSARLLYEYVLKDREFNSSVGLPNGLSETR